MMVAEESPTEQTSAMFQRGAAYIEDPQTRVIVECIADLYQDGQIPSAIAIQLMMDLDVDYQAFHSPQVPRRGRESWKAKTSIQLLFAKSVETDEVFRRRVWNYIRENVAWLGSFSQQSVYQGGNGYARAVAE
jgi:hypothetical protein